MRPCLLDSRRQVCRHRAPKASSTPATDGPQSWHGVSTRRAFTLIEILVVVGIVGLLVAILLPSLKRARFQARLAVCASNLKQVGMGIHMYAVDARGFIPRGPEPAWPYDFGTSRYATNQLWIGAKPAPGTSHAYTGLGLLLRRINPVPQALFCPDDNTFTLDSELPHIGTDGNTWCSYLYRHLDALPEGHGQGRLDRLGANIIDGHRVTIEALAVDGNSLGEGAMYHTNHQAERANVLFRDGSARSFDNRRNAFTLWQTQPLLDLPLLLTVLKQVFINGDYGYHGSVDRAPRLPGIPITRPQMGAPAGA